MSLDPLDPILDGSRLRSSIFSQMELRGAWGFQKPKLEGAPFYIITSGQCLIRLANCEAVTASEGDLVILPTGDAHDFMIDLSAQLVSFKQVLAGLGWAAWTPGMRYKTGVLGYSAGDDGFTSIIAGIFEFEDFSKNPLLLRLPGILRLPHGESTAEYGNELHSVLRLLISEVRGALAGSGAVAGRLADLLFVYAVRLFLRTEPSPAVSWLRGLQDPCIGKVLPAIHSEPGRAWTVQTLGAEAGMSRARFAARFQELVGQSPVAYVTEWRMHRAARDLVADRKTLASISFDQGYSSEIAFSKAFKRWSGQLPREYRRASPAWPSENEPTTPSRLATNDGS